MKGLFLLLPLATVLLGLYYIHYSLRVLLPHQRLLRLIVDGVNIAMLASMVLLFLTRAALPTAIVSPLYHFSTAWVFVILYVLMLCLVLSSLRFIPLLQPYLSDSPRLALALGVGLVALLGYGYWHYEQKERVELSLELAKPMPRSLKVVALSDLHLGYTISRAELARWVDMINAESPDLILIAGDVIDGYLRPVIESGMHEELTRLRSRLGVYACLGNHEYIQGGHQQADWFARAGIRLLRDEAVLVDNSLYIIGRDDRTARGRKPLDSLVAGLDRDKPMILLDHQPYHLEEAERVGIDLQLSGHTHRGQVFPINLLVDLMYERSHGYYRRGGTQYYISSGLGIWGGKFRIGTQSEYVCMTLKGKGA